MDTADNSKQASFNADTLKQHIKGIRDWAAANPELAGAAAGAIGGGLTTDSVRGALFGGLIGAGARAGYRGLKGEDMVEKWNSLADIILNKRQQQPVYIGADTGGEKQASFGKNLLEAGKSIAKTIKENDVARNTALAAGLGAAGLGGLGYAAYKGAQQPDEEEQAAIDADPNLTAKEKRERKKSWIRRHPFLTAGLAAGLGGAGLYGAAKFTDWRNSEKGNDAWQGMKDALSENGLEDNPIAKKLGLRLADFRPDRIDKTIFGEGHAPGQLSRAFFDKIQREGKAELSDLDILKMKTGMNDKDAKKYLESIRNSRSQSDIENSLMGYTRVNPAKKTTFYSKPDDAAAALGLRAGAGGKWVEAAGPFSSAINARKSDNGGVDIDDVIFAPAKFSGRADMMKADQKFNGYFNKNVDGDPDKLMTPESVIGHEASHGSNWHGVSSGPGQRYRPTRVRLARLSFDPNTTLRAGQRVYPGGVPVLTVNTAAMDRMQDAFLNGPFNKKKYLGDMTYPLYSPGEASQVLATMKQQAIAMNGGKAPTTERGWRKALEHLAMSKPISGEQYRFQSYITPQDEDKDLALATRKEVIRRILDELYRKDSRGIHSFGQLGNSMRSDIA